MLKINEYLTLHSLQCSATPTTGNVRRWQIQPLLSFSATVKTLFIASIELDGMEMVDSFRLAPEPGEALLELPELFVVNPLFSTEDQQHPYRIVLKIHAGHGVTHELSDNFLFRKEPEPTSNPQNP